MLLVQSLVFYSWGEGYYVSLFLFSMLLNWSFGIALAAVTKSKKLVFAAGLCANLLLLGYFKYFGFFSESFSDSSSGGIHLPLGISFFTFHGLSYLFDIYRGTSAVEKNPITVGLYLAFYPQLVAGPIVRFKEIATQLHSRSLEIVAMRNGVSRFIVGLAKKVLIANQLALYADAAFALNPQELSSSDAWLGLICYGLQIYFDFSGYSDMAIGLAQMFGFQFPENFNYPYASKSIREFWQRWHISLSQWFRDYLYIPLGGNRGSALSTARNLCLVFLLCGLWHGASWNFIIWGLLHGLFLSLERSGFGRILERAPQLVKSLYSLLIVFLLWVPFRSHDLSHTLEYWRALIPGWETSNAFLSTYQTHRMVVSLLVAAFLSVGCCKNVFKNHGIIQILLLGLLFVCSLSELARGSYNPFIYFRF